VISGRRSLLRIGALGGLASGVAWWPPVTLRQVALLVRQLAMMVAAGLPLAESLDVLHQQQENRRLRDAVRAIQADVKSGRSLARAMGRHPRIFGRLTVAMTAIGEAGGQLDQSLLRLSGELDKSARMAARVRGAFAYPLVVGSIGILVVAVILWQVVPVFAELYAGLDAELPLATRIVIGASESLGTHASLGLFTVLGLSLLAGRLRRTQAGGAFLDRLVLRVPLFGKLVFRAALARFCRTLATLVGAGLPVLEGMDIARRTVGNQHLEKTMDRVRARVETGSSLSGPLRQAGMFPPMVCQMVAVGERTGDLDFALEKVADFYEDEVRRASETVLPLLEPLLILVLGVLIGVIVIAMYMPIWTLVGRLA